jgi:hypothetical protein
MSLQPQSVYPAVEICGVVRPIPVGYYCWCLAAVPLYAGWCASFTACRDLSPDWGAAYYCCVPAGSAASYHCVSAGDAASYFCVFVGGATTYSDIGFLAERCRAVVHLLRVRPLLRTAVPCLCWAGGKAPTLSTVKRGFTYSLVSIDLGFSLVKFCWEGFGFLCFCSCNP